MDSYFPGFNSFNWQKKELILNQKYCKWLGNIFAYPGFKDEGWSLGKGLGGNRAKEIGVPLKQERSGVSLPAIRKVGFWWQNPEKRSWVERLNLGEFREGKSRWPSSHSQGERNLITPRKRWGSNPTNEKNQGAKTRVLQTYPLKKISSSRFPGLPPGEGGLTFVRLGSMSCSLCVGLLSL